MNKVALHLSQAATALRFWGSRQWIVAVAAAVATLVLLGIATVLIPNSIFGRDIPPTWWSYPAWVVTSILSGMLIATYVRTGPVAPVDQSGSTDKTSVWGTLGAVGAWFAIGCPVCNKIALLAFGYTGAIQYFGPIQPVLAIVSLGLLTVGLVLRLSGQVACVMPRSRVEA